MADMRQLTYQEVIETLARHEEEAGAPAFTCKLLRRASPGSPSVAHVANFVDVSTRHISDAETWIAPLCGGGLYALMVYDKAGKPRGQISVNEIAGPPRAIVPEVARGSGWLGPTLVYQEPPKNAAAVALGPDLTPPATPSRADASGEVGALRAELAREQAERKRIEREKLEAEHAREVDRVRKEADERVSKLEAQIAQLAARPPERTGPNLAEILTPIAGIVGPVVTAIFSGMAEDRKARLDLERVRLEREAAKADKPLFPPELLAILQGAAERNEKQAEQFSSLMRAQAESARITAEGQAVTSRTMLQTIADVMQLQLKSSGEPAGIDWGQIIGGGLQAVAALAQSRQPTGAAPQPAMIPTPGLPAAPPAVMPAPRPPVSPSPALDALQQKVFAKAPPTVIVEDLKRALALPDVRAEIQARGGLIETFEARLGVFAAQPQNQKYMAALLAALEKSGIIQGEEEPAAEQPEEQPEQPEEQPAEIPLDGNAATA